MVNKYIIVVVLFLSNSVVFAADSLGNKYPKAVLVQLRAEQNRIVALTAARKHKDAAGVAEDAKKIQEAMINDFHDNFKYCPVYYFIDTNADAVKNKQFNNILLNSDGTVSVNPVINNKSTEYLVVYYGYPNAQERKDKVGSGAPSASGKGLVILNHKYEQTGYFLRYGYGELFRSKKNRDKYSWSSKRYDMEYSPFAQVLNNEISGREHSSSFRGYIPKRSSSKQ